MFTGLIERMGTVVAVEPRGEGLRLEIGAPGWQGDPREGDSVAINGCCLTAALVSDAGFAADVVPETVRRTRLGRLRVGDPVNLERAMRLDQRLGGHLVQGHIDGVGRVVSVRTEGEGRRIAFELQRSPAPYVAEKGSIAIDGVSLTVAACEGARCEVAYIPYTLQSTVAGRYVEGADVHVEVDVVARYVARALHAGLATDRHVAGEES